MSPELLDPESFGLTKIRPTKESDCYALGMVIYEVLSGLTPFAPYGSPIIIRKVLDGERPGRPQGEEGLLFTDGIWLVVKLCWQARPGDRSSAKAVLLGLEGNPSASRLISNMETDEETDTDDQSDATANESSVFSLSNPGLVLNHTSGIIGSTIANNGNILLGSRHRSCASSSNISLDGQVPDLPEKGSSRQGWVGILARNPRKMLKAVTRRLCGLSRVKRTPRGWIGSIRRGYLPGPTPHR